MSKLIRIGIVAGLLAGSLSLAAPALASHDHVLLLGNGSCVVLAADGNENQVELPFAGDQPEGRRHPLHVLVHLGNAGTRGGEPVIFVAGSPAADAACDGYVNQ